MREIVFDTETTGFSPEAGHKITEIGCVELVNRIETGRYFHSYLDPEREVDEGAARVTGLTWAKLKGQPLFKDIAAELVEFIGDSPLVAHNADFDMTFLNAELTMAGFSEVVNDVVDTLTMARKVLPGARHSLDALCQRYEVQLLNERDVHGALLDARLLAEVYLELTGGRQGSLLGGGGDVEEVAEAHFQLRERPVRPARSFPPSAEEVAAHEAFVAEIKDALWTKNS